MARDSLALIALLAFILAIWAWSIPAPPLPV